MEEFARVWARVTGESQPPPDEIRRLAGFMDGTEAARRRFLALAGRSPRLARGLREMAAEQRELSGRLLLEYFLLTGDSYAPAASVPLCPGLLGGLRLACLTAEENCRKYMQAASETASPDLRRVYDGCAAAENRQVGRLRQMLGESIASGSLATMPEI